jgi:hypothetical protein
MSPAKAIKIGNVNFALLVVYLVPPPKSNVSSRKAATQ